MSKERDSEASAWTMPDRLRQELELALRGEIQTALHLERALKGDQHAVALVWRAIAEGQANIAMRDLWVKHVANAVVKRVLDVDALDRPAAALNAIGLTGPRDKHEELVEAIVTQLQFDAAARAGATDARSGATSRADMAKMMQERGFLNGKALSGAMKTLDRLRPQIEARLEKTVPKISLASGGWTAVISPNDIVQETSDAFTGSLSPPQGGA